MFQNNLTWGFGRWIRLALLPTQASTAAAALAPPAMSFAITLFTWAIASMHFAEKIVILICHVTLSGYNKSGSLSVSLHSLAFQPIDAQKSI